MLRICGVIAIAVPLFFCGIVQAASVDKVIAVVNDDVITQLELETRLSGLSAEIKSRGGTMPPKEVLRKQMLQRMINDKLQLQAAERFKITVSEPELDAAVLSVAQNNKLTMRQLREALAAEGIPYALFRESIKTQIVISQIFNQRIRNRVEVTEQELDDFLARGGGRAEATEFNISHILIRIPETPNPNDVDRARAKADAAWSELKQGMTFGVAAATYSDAPDALDGGRLGWRTPGQLPDIFTEELQTLDVGKFSKILQSANGFHILYVNDVRGATAVAITQTNVRHILMKTDEFLSEAEAGHRLEEIRNRVINGDDFAELARVYSADPVSAARGGELGWVSPGELTGPFEQVMNNLKPGEISRPVQSSFGLHLIQVLDRREQVAGEKVTRARARGQLMGQKSDELYEQWLRRLSDESYIEILDDELK